MDPRLACPSCESVDLKRGWLCRPSVPGMATFVRTIYAVLSNGGEGSYVGCFSRLGRVSILQTSGLQKELNQVADMP